MKQIIKSYTKGYTIALLFVLTVIFFVDLSLGIQTGNIVTTKDSVFYIVANSFTPNIFDHFEIYAVGDAFFGLFIGSRHFTLLCFMFAGYFGGLAIIFFMKRIGYDTWEEMYEVLAIPLHYFIVCLLVGSLTSRLLDLNYAYQTNTTNLINKSTEVSCLVNAKCAILYNAPHQTKDDKLYLITAKTIQGKRYLSDNRIKNLYSNESQFGDLWLKMNNIPESQ